MRVKTYRLAGALTLGVLMAACGGSKESATDSATSADLSMANAATAQPALADTAAAHKEAAATTPAASKPSKPASKPATPAPAPAKTSGEIALGTSLLLHPAATVCTDSNKVGETVHARVAEAVHGTNGVSIPEGAIVNLKIATLKRSENAKDPIDMGLNPESVEFGGKTYALSATVTSEKIDRIRNEPKSKDVQKVVGGAVVGALAGKLIGKSTKGAVVGAAAGAAAGAGVAAATANYEGCIAQGSNLTIKLSAPVVIH